MKDVLRNKLNSIYHIILDNKDENLGTLSGLSGSSLFLFNYAKFSKNDLIASKGGEILDLCINKINEYYYNPSYCEGITGFGWGLIKLYENEEIDLDLNNTLLQLDNFINKSMTLSMNKNNYDFLYGVIGYGFYFLKRYKITKEKVLRAQYKKYLIELISALGILAEVEGDGLKWHSVVNIKTGGKGYNLSLSHGMSSIINLLTRFYLIEEFKTSVEDMLKGGINFILSYKSKDLNSISLFPNYIKPNEKPKYNSRLAWCYGDLGIGLSLWKASKALKDKALEMKAIDILKHSSKRRQKDNTMVMDAGLCHGSFGNAQIFNYLYRQTKIKEFKSACEFWIYDGLDKAYHKDGFAGFKKWSPNTNDWKNELSVIEGIAGIGLSIISFLSEEDTNWDECLMIS